MRRQRPRAPPTPAAAPGAGRAAAPWTWKVGTVEIADTKATVVLESPPLVVEIAKGTITGLESAAGTRAARRSPDQGGAGDARPHRDGRARSARGAARRADPGGVALGRLLTAASGPAPVRLPTGTLARRPDHPGRSGPADRRRQARDRGSRRAASEGGGLRRRLEAARGWASRKRACRACCPASKPTTPEPMRIDLERLALTDAGRDPDADRERSRAPRERRAGGGDDR